MLWINEHLSLYGEAEGRYQIFCHASVVFLLLEQSVVRVMAV